VSGLDVEGGCHGRTTSRPGGTIVAMDAVHSRRVCLQNLRADLFVRLSWLLTGQSTNSFGQSRSVGQHARSLCRGQCVSVCILPCQKHDVEVKGRRAGQLQKAGLRCSTEVSPDCRHTGQAGSAAYCSRCRKILGVQPEQHNQLQRSGRLTRR
jgi:hypothetical protein